MADSSAQTCKQLKELPTGQDQRSKRVRKQMFHQVDENGNGILSLAEVDHACENRWNLHIAKNVINRAFHAARDMAKPVAEFSDDYIDLSEFRIFLVYMQHYYELHSIFMQMDTSGDGRLGTDEFARSVPLLKSWGVAGLDNPAACFQKMDIDGGGMVLFDEFAHWALHQGVSDLVEDAGDRAEALTLLRAADANLASKDMDDMGRARYSVTEGIQGQGALGKADVGRLLLAGALAGPGFLVVNVHQANGLRIADRTTSDPYVVLSYGGEEHQTKTIKRNLNPIWNETIRFTVTGKLLEINVFDYDVLSSDDFLGRVTIDERTLLSDREHRSRLTLTGPKAQGTIDVSFRWQSLASRRRTC